MGREYRGMGNGGARRLRGPALLAAVLALAAVPAYAMHISDGVLPTGHALLWFVLCAPFLALGVRDLNRRKEKDLNYVPLVAMVGAAVFVLSVFHIPVAVAGSSSHPTGGALAAILVGPLPAIVLNCIALLFQALFLAHGGLSSWGANTFSMGVVGVLVGYGTFLALGRFRWPLFVRAGIAGFVSNLLGTYGTAALQLALSLHGDRSVAQAWAVFMMGYLPPQAPLAVLDFVLAGYMCEFIAQRRPDIAGSLGLRGVRRAVAPEALPVVASEAQPAVEG